MWNITTQRCGPIQSTSPPKGSSTSSRKTPIEIRGSDFFRQLLESKGPAKSPVFGMEVVAQSRRDVVEDGRAWVDIELTLKVIAGDRKQTMRFRVDPKTKLPHSCVFQSIEGPIGTRLFDYPDRGPADIYDLGVPRTAKLVDRMPTNDLDGVLAGLKAGRVRFDDYRGIADDGRFRRQPRVAQGTQVARGAFAAQPEGSAAVPPRRRRSVVEGASE